MLDMDVEELTIEIENSHEEIRNKQVVCICHRTYNLTYLLISRSKKTCSFLATFVGKFVSRRVVEPNTREANTWTNWERDQLGKTSLFRWIIQRISSESLSLFNRRETLQARASCKGF